MHFQSILSLKQTFFWATNIFAGEFETNESKKNKQTSEKDGDFNFLEVV